MNPLSNRRFVSDAYVSALRAFFSAPQPGRWAAAIRSLTCKYASPELISVWVGAFFDLRLQVATNAK